MGCLRGDAHVKPAYREVGRCVFSVLRVYPNGRTGGTECGPSLTRVESHVSVSQLPTDSVFPVQSGTIGSATGCRARAGGSARPEFPSRPTRPRFRRTTRR